MNLCSLLMAVLVFALANSAMAAGNESLSLSLTYVQKNMVFENLSVSVYKVADMELSGAYILSGEFKDYSVELNGNKTATDWKNTANTLSGYASDDNLRPVAVLRTDKEGKASVTDLEKGMYLIVTGSYERYTDKYIFDPFLVSLPSADTDNNWSYNVEVSPKSEGHSIGEESIKYKLVKVWKDDGASVKRPDSVSINILRDGEFYETVVLSAENNWTYSWIAESSYSWQAVEQNVPEGYKAVSSASGSIISVINTANTTTPPPDDGEGDTPPYTGDTTDMSYSVTIFVFSGLVLVFTGWYLINKSKKEKSKA